MDNEKIEINDVKQNSVRDKNVLLMVQIVFFVLIAAIVINRYLAESIGKALPFLSQASIHAICPFGGVVSAYQFFTVGTFVQRIHESSFVLMMIVFFMAIMLGAVFCGWVCPLGSIQEWFGKFGRNLFGKKYNTFIPEKIDKPLHYLRYVFLVWVLYVVAKSGTLIYQNYDPFFALFKFWTGEAALTSIAILIILLLGSLFIERPWCKYVCPYGGLLGAFNKIRFWQIQRNPDACIDCKKCDKACPMNIKISEKTVITDSTCNTCMRCVLDETCPKQGVLELRAYNPFASKNSTPTIVERSEQ